jgi:hypothetical protein
MVSATTWLKPVCCPIQSIYINSCIVTTNQHYTTIIVDSDNRYDAFDISECLVVIVVCSAIVDPHNSSLV